MNAEISDSAGVQAIPDVLRKPGPRIKHRIAIGAYDRGKLMDNVAFLDSVIEIVRGMDTTPYINVSLRGRVASANGVVHAVSWVHRLSDASLSARRSIAKRPAW